MAGRKSAATAAVSAKDAGQPISTADRDKLTDRQLAKAVLRKTLRPRVAEVRRLATAVLAQNPPKAPKKRGKKAKSGKLAKIPRPRAN